MRLLNTTTLKIYEFTGKKIPKYAILSHRWEAHESSFQDARDRENLDSTGWKKIQRFCAFAKKWDWEYAWADTCCIDKTSSSELSESINSMYTYYRNAEECYAYLNDVPANLAPEAKIDALRRSKWFTRGWTLQELLAPLELYFLDRNWKIIGSKKTLGDVLSKITGIENVATVDPSTNSVAIRMSWASKRECTREEDNAYCLMGIFSINMPLLYGEGENAFKRLQLEILKTSDDESLFAWWSPLTDFKLQTGLLATSPHDFRSSADISPYPFYADRAPYDMTNKGLQIEASLIPCNWIFGNNEDASSPPYMNADLPGDYSIDKHYVNPPSSQGKHNLYQFVGTTRHIRSDGYRPFSYSPSEPAHEPRIWIFPLNCRIRSKSHPIVLILADWGTKSGQCCRLFSERSSDESFGPEWIANWRAFGSMTRRTYIREADLEARWILGKKYITPASVRAALSKFDVQAIPPLYGQKSDEDGSICNIDFTSDLGEP